ncbi:hypothetical protein D9758_008808 [Tetrapyrgos nigripes]|uniref:Helicase ATP-binding domain-containing protein n=1 Tax=Tetrapyrgos nigripes TaxID=182062 RepID=A0A8H5D4S7_9AGAR|nr:hypothetical protein D9758_008808 [Tetrapyrgos nigripes]
MRSILPVIHDLTPTTMLERYCWQSSEGQALLNDIVQKCVPQWTNGLKDGQIRAITRILDREQVVWVAATGEGQNPELCPSFVTKEKPVGIVVTPMKGLATNINIADDVIKGVDVVQEISNCKYHIIYVDPAHLKKNKWNQIASNPTFYCNIIFACAEEAHLIDEWGNTDFCLDFRYIGVYFHSHLPSNISFFALSATIEPRKPTTIICHHLGFREPSFHLIQGSNEHLNTQFIVEPLSHGIGGKNFPQLLPYLTSGQKTIIHRQMLEAVLDKYNADTLNMLENNQNCQIIIATVAFTNGISMQMLLDSISLGLASSLNIIWQEKGHAGCNPESLAQGIVLVSPTAIKNAEKYIEGM